MGSVEGPEAQASDRFRVFFIPFFVPSHINPMTSLARAFAARGVDVVMVVTPANGDLIRGTVELAAGAGLPISLLHFPFPAAEVGLAEGIENLATAPPGEEGKIYHAVFIAHGTLERLLRKHRPNAVVVDSFFAGLNGTARDLGIPTVALNGTGAFTSVAFSRIMTHNPFAGVADGNNALFLVPDIPDKVEMPWSELPVSNISDGGTWKTIGNSMEKCLAILYSTFYDLEPAYCDLLGERSFFVGPYSLWSLNNQEVEEGKSPDDDECLAWLETQATVSVVYVAFGSFTSFSKEQHWELALGLEASGRPFLWALREKNFGEKNQVSLLPEGFEERVRGRGLVVKGWVPQVAILNHRATGAFVTHMGWNSLTDGLMAGVPMISWPLAHEQFVNERFAIDILKTSVRMWDGFRSVAPEEAAKAQVKAEAISRVVSRFLPPDSADEEVEAMRGRATVYGAMARAAVKEGGAAYNELTRLIDALKSFRPGAISGAVSVS